MKTSTKRSASLESGPVDLKVRDQRICEHLDYVRHIASRLISDLPSSVDEENLLSAGVLGLIQAAENFDDSRGVVFKTFAYPRIHGAMIDELRRNCPLPQRILQNLSLVRATIERLIPPTSVELIAAESKLSVAEVEECLAGSRLTNMHSWDDHDTVHSVRTGRDDRPESRIEDSEKRQQLAKAIEQLPERERLVVTLYYMEDLRLKEIGAAIELSESRVCRLLARAEHQLKETVRRWSLDVENSTITRGTSL